MEFLNEITKLIPKCPICFTISTNNLTICYNGHFLCHDCYDNMNTNSSCPMCRELLIPTPLKNQWSNEFIEAIKKQIVDASPFKIGNQVDYFYENSWQHGKIIDINLEQQAFEIESETFQKDDKACAISLENSHLLKTSFSMTPNWRNYEFLSNCKSVRVCLCEEMFNSSFSCDPTFCSHEQIWVKAEIVYMCRISQYILCVFIHEYNDNANSQWFSINSKRLGLIKN